MGVNAGTINGGRSASYARRGADDYETPAWVTEALLARESFPGVCWEPACGRGAMASLLGSDTIATDLYDYGYGRGGVDFLTADYRGIDHIITNPPYNLAQAFAEHALKRAQGKVALLLRLQFLEGQRRGKWLPQTPLKTVYVSSRRVVFCPERGTSPTIAFAWFVWEQGFHGRPTIGWF